MIKLFQILCNVQNCPAPRWNDTTKTASDSLVSTLLQFPRRTSNKTAKKFQWFFLTICVERFFLDNKLVLLLCIRRSPAVFYLHLIECYLSGVKKLIVLMAMFILLFSLLDVLTACTRYPVGVWSALGWSAERYWELESSSYYPSTDSSAAIAKNCVSIFDCVGIETIAI